MEKPMWNELLLIQLDSEFIEEVLPVVQAHEKQASTK